MKDSQPEGTAAFQTRREALQARVNEAATALLEQGIRPTVSRVRAALGGGSPNDLAPAVKVWRETVWPRLSVGRGERSAGPPLPLQLDDLVRELWQRAVAAALVEVRGGPTAREVAARTAEAQGLRQQLTAVRDQLQRESLAYGELRAQAARHEVIAREALARVHEGELRERRLLRELGGLRQRVAELEVLAERGQRRLGVRRVAVGGGESVSGGGKRARARKGRGSRGVRKEGRRRRAPKDRGVGGRAARSGGALRSRERMPPAKRGGKKKR